VETSALPNEPAGKLRLYHPPAAQNLELMLIVSFAGKLRLFHPPAAQNLELMLIASFAGKLRLSN
jgi:Co/Zn/Cd efflux system component